MSALLKILLFVTIARYENHQKMEIHMRHEAEMEQMLIEEDRAEAVEERAQAMEALRREKEQAEKEAAEASSE